MSRKSHNRTTAHDRYLIRQLALERLRLKFRYDLACLKLAHLRDQRKADREPKKIHDLELYVNNLATQLEALEYQKIAEKFDVARNTITMICRGRGAKRYE